MMVTFWYGPPRGPATLLRRVRPYGTLDHQRTDGSTESYFVLFHSPEVCSRPFHRSAGMYFVR